MTEEMENRLKNIIIRHSRLKISHSDIHNESEMINDFGYDSVSTIRLVIDIEKEFGIDINDENLSFEKIGKYGSLKKIIGEKLSL
jgi:acyl carrier protein